MQNQEPIEQLISLGIPYDAASQMIEDALAKQYPIRNRDVARRYGISQELAIRAAIITKPIRNLPEPL